jgi:hypothetical protein
VTDETPGAVSVPAPKAALGPLELLPLGLAVAGATLLLGGVLFALANAAADTTGTADRFRLLGQAANPFISFLSLTAAALVVDARRRPGGRVVTAGGAALGVATAVSLAVVLLALNGILTDLTGDTTALFRLSAIVSRMATLVLSGVALWLAVASGPARP